jgi:hypothetical protein
MDTESGSGSRNAKRIDKKSREKGIYVLNNWIFSLEGWRGLLLEALEKYIATYILSK